MSGWKSPVSGLSLIWAMDRNRVIGKDNKLPWRLPAEMAYFREVTMGHTVVMGRRTFESIGKPLKGRRNVILTRNRSYRQPDCEVAHDVEEVLARFGGETLFIIGGAQVYRAFLPYAEKLYVTVIDHAFDGDETFPEFDLSEWTLISERPGPTDVDNPYPFTFQVFERSERLRL